MKKTFLAVSAIVGTMFMLTGVTVGVAVLLAGSDTVVVERFRDNVFRIALHVTGLDESLHRFVEGTIGWADLAVAHAVERRIKYPDPALQAKIDDLVKESVDKEVKKALAKRRSANPPPRSAPSTQCAQPEAALAEHVNSAAGEVEI